MHLQQAADALLAVLGRHVDRVARIQRAGIDAEERQVADERIVQDLERQRRERLVVIGLARDRLAVRIDALDVGHLDRRGHELDHRIEQRLHALVLERRAAHAQHHFVLERAGLQAALDLLVGERLALEVLGDQVLVALGRRFDHLVAVLLALRPSSRAGCRGTRTSCPGFPCPSRSPSCGSGRPRRRTCLPRRSAAGSGPDWRAGACGSCRRSA